MQNSKYNNINPIFLLVVYLLPPIVAAILFAVNAMWLLAVISVILGVGFYIASTREDVSRRKIVFFMISSSLALYSALFAVWGLHIIAIILCILAVLLAIFLSKDELKDKLTYGLIAFFIIVAIANIIENVSKPTAIMWYCVVFQFVTAMLLILRSVLTARKS